MGPNSGNRPVPNGEILHLLSNTPFRYEYIDQEANADRMSERLMAIVAEGRRGRVYLSPTDEMEAIARSARPTWKPDAPSRGTWASNAQGRRYGFRTFGDYFMPRQLVALTTFSNLIQEVREHVQRDALSAGVTGDERPLRNAGAGAVAYAEAVEVYLTFVLARVLHYGSSLCTWLAKDAAIARTFTKQAIQMTWDYAEGSVFGKSSTGWPKCVEVITSAIEFLPTSGISFATLENATTHSPVNAGCYVVSTDPPYYSNIGYADLSDYFYVWERRALQSVFPDLFGTLAVPKGEELVATTSRHGNKKEAEAFFLKGMTQAMERLVASAHPIFPVTIYYAFKQTETESDEGTASTGWETFLDAIIRAGFAISGTWPMRTEGDNRQIGVGANALASSIVLVCRPLPRDAHTATRREFITALKAELPSALGHLQRQNIAPVDLAQAAIGPGMAVYTRWPKVLDAEGNRVPVREALALINQVLDETLAEQEGDFDAGSRFALAWFEQHGFAEGEFGVADVLARAKVTSVEGLRDAGILESKRGKVRLFKPNELPGDWDPSTKSRLTNWETVHHLIRALEAAGDAAAAGLIAKLGTNAETARELAYRLYTVCERKKRAGEALSYNALVQSWPEITRLAREGGKPRSEQAGLFSETEE